MVVTLIISDVPSPPRDVGVSEVFSSSCLLSWSAPEDDGGSPLTLYVVEARNMDKKEKWTEVAEVRADTLSHTVTGLADNNKYRFRVRALNKVGPSDPAELADTVLARDPWSFPGPPLNLQISDWDKSFVDLNWQPPEKDGGAPVLRYVVEAKEKFGKEWVRCGLTEDASLATRVEDGIQEGKTYEFRVKAVNKAGEGQPSAPTKPVLVKSRFVKPYIVGDKMADLVVKRGQNLSWDITYAGEPDPEVQWFFGDQKIEPDGDR